GSSQMVFRTFSVRTHRGPLAGTQVIEIVGAGEGNRTLVVSLENCNRREEAKCPARNPRAGAGGSGLRPSRPLRRRWSLIGSGHWVGDTRTTDKVLKNCRLARAVASIKT